jgi:2-polyprenyl-6-methoxyphenol hydroxylase-like FAD-dependent oxidoreductase
MHVLIVGGGIAGPTLAYWLLRGGHEVTLVERAPELRRGGYVVDFWGAGLEVAQRMGIVPDLRRRSHPLVEARAVDQGGRLVATLRPSALVESRQGYLSIARSELAAVINESLGGQIEAMLDDTVQSLVDDGLRVQVQFESGHIGTYDLIVGADGLHSRVRKLVFGHDAQFERYLGMVVAAFEVEGYRPRDEQIAVMHAAVGFQAVRLSLRDDLTLFLLTVRHDGEVPRDDRAAQQALLRTKLAGQGWEVPGMLEVMPEAKTFYFDSVSQIRMPTWTRGRVALVGDAAACPSLLSGQGSALAMVESYALAAELCRGGDHRDAFDRYEKRLAPLLRSKQDAARGLALAFAPKSRHQLLLRDTVMRLMALPKLADLAMGRSLRDAVELPAFPAT